jgi:hypothetical protein
MVFPNLVRVLYEASWLEGICPVGRGSGMTLCRRRLELAPNPLVNCNVPILGHYNITRFQSVMPT